MTSFSKLLEQRLAEEVTKTVEMKKALEQDQWLKRVHTTSTWLKKVFDDKSFVLLGYKLKLRKKSRNDDHFLTVYFRVGNLIFGLETSQNLGKHKANFGICRPRASRSGVKSQLFNLQQIYKENNQLETLVFNADFSDWRAQPITDNTHQSQMGRERLRKELVLAVVNVLTRIPNLTDAETVNLILEDLPKHHYMHMLIPETIDTKPAGRPFIEDEAAYFASLDPKILSQQVEELVRTQKFGFDDSDRVVFLAALEENMIFTVSDLLQLTEQDLWNRVGTGVGYRQIIDSLADLDLELIPLNGAKRLAAGIPKTVDKLLNHSRSKSAERARNCLLRAQIKTTSELIQKTPEDLLKLTNFGQKSLEKVIEALALYDLSLKIE